MTVGSLEIPASLLKLIESGMWPSHRNAVAEQNSRSLIPEDRNRRLRRICLYPPPFKTLTQAAACKGLEDFYTRCGAIHEIVPEAAIEIADFGIGADSPILLDYRRGPSDPRVIYLEWPGGGCDSYWVELASDFDSFAEMLGLLPPAAA